MCRAGSPAREERWRKVADLLARLAGRLQLLDLDLLQLVGDEPQAPRRQVLVVGEDDRHERLRPGERVLLAAGAAAALEQLAPQIVVVAAGTLAVCLRFGARCFARLGLLLGGRVGVNAAAPGAPFLLALGPLRRFGLHPLDRALAEVGGESLVGDERDGRDPFAAVDPVLDQNAGRPRGVDLGAAEADHRLGLLCAAPDLP